jgi:hypothetical protein
MHKIKTPIVLACMVGALLVCAPAALAEFKSVGKGSEGKTSSSALNVEAGGATIQCAPEEETKGDGTWVIENKEKTHVEKGPDLIVKSKTWGECKAKAGGIETKEGAVTGSECELGAEEPKEESRGLADVVSNCTFKIEVKKESICEIKVEAGENKELNEVGMGHSGENNENLILSFELGGVKTKTSGTACTTAKITSTTSGKLDDGVEGKNVGDGEQVGEFVLSFSGGGAYLKPRGSQRTVSVIYRGTSVNPIILGNGALSAQETTGDFRTPAPEQFFGFASGSNTIITCQNFQFTNTNRVCNMTIESIKLSNELQPLMYLTVRVSFLNAENLVRMFV